jgi:hypothetical protein
VELINTLETPGEFDALTTLRPGEPYFLLVGRDRLAPGLVLRWASYNRRRALREFNAKQIDGPKRERELRKSTQAEEIAWGMQAYKQGHQTVAVEPRLVTYSGHELPAETLHRDKQQAAAARATAALNNAVAELALLAELTEGERQWALQSEIEHLQSLAATIKPARPIPGQ